ncbi:hypothetical protein D0C36_03095 [Mucilaginibacter conchicola]|uniref:Uncharacterized protein n=1 Tax=Mucilaginibacter conchicola TaxID=2303333 RepID=A0A372NYF8_9SPHI|nr:hypothetical protein D0C36_03095 [Mucilaginibacter conchicola]
MYDKAETIINGIKSTYPPVISAIRNIAVNGACSTPLNAPAIPTAIKLLVFKWMRPVWFTAKATNSPKNAPVNMVGANVPPLPPEPIVTPAAMILVSTSAAINNSISHGLDSQSLKKRSSFNTSILPLSICCK